MSSCQPKTCTLQWPAQSSGGLLTSCCRAEVGAGTETQQQADGPVVSRLIEHVLRFAAQRSVLLPGRNNRLMNLHSCREACAKQAGCNAWLYCWRPGGCDDGVEYNPRWWASHVDQASNTPI